MKKIKFLIILVLCMILNLIIQPVYASFEADPEPPITITPRFTSISSVATGLRASGGTATCDADITGKSSSSNLKIYMYLERYVSGTWTPYSSWSASKTGISLSLSKTVSIAKGTYRVKASYYANGENVVQYSATKIY